MSRPVIIGSSMTGLLISRSLARAGVDHLLLGGGRPDDRPRLGESTNEAAALAFACTQDEGLRRFTFGKSHISLFHGDVVSMVQFDGPDRKLVDRPCGQGLLRYTDAVRSTHHIDRVPFDQALYDLAVGDRHCELIQQGVAAVSTDAGRVTSLRLDSGATLDDLPYVFDATGGRCIVGEALGVPRRVVSRPQRVVWTRYHGDKPGGDAPWWQHGTNLVRLDRGRDGIDAIAWVIPMGGIVSLGMSIDAASGPTEALLDLLVQAVERRGLRLRERFPQVDHPMSMFHDYGIRAQAHGPNWLLSGPTFMQAWFPSSSGMSTSLAAATLAPRLLSQPDLGRRYQDVTTELLGFHDYLEPMIHGAPHRTIAAGIDFWSGWVAAIPGRLAAAFSLQDPDLPTRIAGRAMRTLSAVSARSPVLQLALWGMAFIHAVQQPDLGRQVDCFPSYKHYRRTVALGWTRWPGYVLSRVGGG